MKATKLCVLFSCLIMLSAFSGGSAEANGRLQVFFRSGDGTPTTNTYLYLRDATKRLSPNEKYFSAPDQIYGPYWGFVNASVPAGVYYVRVTRRKQAPFTPFGPPLPGDYTWSPLTAVVVTDNVTTNLGDLYAINYTFGDVHSVITGVARDYTTGAPLAGKYVRAQDEPCIVGDYPGWDSGIDMGWVDPNLCGFPYIYPAQAKTDAEGRFTILLRKSGTYYVVVSDELGDYSAGYGPDMNWGGPESVLGSGAYGGNITGPFTVGVGATRDINVYVPSF